MIVDLNGTKTAPIIDITDTTQNKRARSFFLYFIITISIAVLLSLWSYSRPTDRVTETVLKIKEGSTVTEISTLLKTNSIIRSPRLFHAYIRFGGHDTQLPSGSFLFLPNKSLFEVIGQLLRREHGIESVRVTIPEGLNTKQVADILTEHLPYFDAKKFSSAVDLPDVYIFPDTYFFYTTATSDEVFMTLSSNFNLKTKSLREEADLSGKKWSDIVTMASIIEEEAVGEINQGLVSGVLWNRIKLGMRLQVDASFSYLFGKTSAQITLTDLAFDSPFNTYKYAGLPPRHMSHPGLVAMTAALHPTATQYLYYLSDNGGKMHYAKTFTEHKLNKEKYLR